MPFYLARATTRRHAGLIALAYFTAALWPIAPASRMFYAGAGPEPTGIILWLLCSALLAVLLCAFHSVSPMLRSPLIVIGLIVHASLPIGVASPFISAGILFPGAGWIGLLNVTFIMLQLSSLTMLNTLSKTLRWIALIAWLVTAVVANLFYLPPSSPPGWKAVDTMFTADRRADFDHLKWLESYALTHDGAVFLFPESTLHSWSGAPKPWLDVDALALSHKTVAFGSQARRGTAPINALFFQGEYSAQYVQRVPVPIAMSRFSGDPFGPAVVEIGGTRAAVLVCYEQLLLAPVLLSVAQRPAVIVAASNLTWVRGTPIPNVQRISIEAWGRLFRLPVVRAVNQ